MKFRLSGEFGELSPVRSGPHNGIDLAIPEGETLRSVSNGVVEALRDYGNNDIGKGIIIKTNDGNSHIYGHLKEIDVVKNQQIHPGDILGETGATGHAHGAHLHFGIQNPQGEFLDPTPLAEPLSNMAGEVTADQLSAAIGSISGGGNWLTKGGNWLLEKYGQTADFIVGKEIELIGAPFWGFVKQNMVMLGQWIVDNLPDLMAYGGMLTGAMVILSTMAGRGMIKPLGFYAAMLIVAICILAG